MYVFARFDEIPSMTLQDIEETKCYGQTAHTYGQSENSIPSTITVCGGIKIKTIRNKMLRICNAYEKCCKQK